MHHQFFSKDTIKQLSLIFNEISFEDNSFQTLENVFLHLCYNDQTRIDQQAATTDTNRSFNISTEVINEHPPSPSNDHRSCLLIFKEILDFLYSGERNFKDVLSDYWRLPKLHKISALAIKDLTVIKRNIG